MYSKRVVASSLVVCVAVACATAEDTPPGASDDDNGGTTSAGQGAAGKLGTGGMAVSQAGTTTVSQGGASSGGKPGASGSAGRGGAGVGSGGSGGIAGSAAAGGGKGGTSAGGGAGVAGSNAGSSGSAGTSTGGTGSTGLACVAGGAGSGGGATSAGGAPSVAAWFDDFENGVATKWTTTLGTWAIVDDGSKVYQQSLHENKLQIAIANDACFADQIIDAKVKVVDFNGQSSSYVAALFGRALSSTTHYLLALGSDGKLALRKRVNSSATGASAIGSAVTTTITAGTWYDVHFEIIGTSLKGCLGSVCVTGTDSSIASGSVAVGTVNASARFDDVRVTPP